MLQSNFIFSSGMYTEVNSAGSLWRIIFIFCLPFLLLACTGGSGEDTVSQGSTPVGNQPPVAATAVDYNGPDPRDQAVRDYKFFFWDEMVKEVTGCTACHMQDGAGTGWFLRNDNINTAHDETLPLVDLNDPGNSQLVSKVYGGHNCWVNDLALCRDTLTDFITNWANGVAATAATQVTLEAPADQLPTGAVNFPDDNGSLFSTTVYPLLTAHCSSCHSDLVPVQQQQTPLFAHSNIETAYEAAKTKIDVANINDSRLVVRLRDESHNCWSDCASDAAEMLAQIDALLPDTADPVDPALITSMALRMEADGIQASSGGRIETHTIAQYEFRLGEGNQVDDRSSVAPLMPLTLLGNYEWQDNWGVRFIDGRAQASVNDSRKLYDELTATGEYTIEAWVFPANVTQDNTARIVSYSGSTMARNFTLGQSLYNYEVLNRSSVTDGNGLPLLSTADADEDAQAALQHVVVTYHPDTGRAIYVNGVDTNDPDLQGGGSINSWDSDFALVLGNEVSGDRSWQGTIRFLAIHNRALSEADIQTNYEAGVGQKYFLLFRLATLNAGNSDPDGFILFEVSQYDNYSYLFSNPHYIALGETSVPTPFVLRGMRVGINGKVPLVGQAFTTLDTVIDGIYDPTTGLEISSRGMILPLEHGADVDQFFLSFEQLGSDTNVFVEATFDAPIFTGSGLEYSDIGLRNFLEIRESFSQITGVSSMNAMVAATYASVVQQLPPKENIAGFLSSHQMGVTQLAITYCDQLVESDQLRTALFPDLDINADANAISDTDWENQFMYPMIDRALNTGLNVQPGRDAVRDELHTLLTSTADIKPVDTDGNAGNDPEGDGVPDGIARCGGSCPIGTTATAAKAGCAAVLSSAAVTFQ